MSDFRFSYVEQYENEADMFMNDNNVVMYSEDYYERFQKRMENENHTFEYCIKNLDELSFDEIIEELDNSLGYVLNVRNSLDVNFHSYKTLKFYDDWTTKFEKTIGNTREKEKFKKQREFLN